MPDSETKSERPKPDPKALTPEYHKARKQLMLWAAILFIWELVGIDLEKAKEVGGNAGALITAIKSPQAVPWVSYFSLVTLVLRLGLNGDNAVICDDLCEKPRWTIILLALLR